MVQVENNSQNWIIDRTAISPYEKYCDGFISPGATGLGYVSALKVETGVARKTGDDVLDGIVAYDRAETTGAYIGQINMITASSFSGIAGQIWGYDLAQHDDIKAGKLIPDFSIQQWDGSYVDCYDARPLLEACEALFGTEGNRRYPLVPGSHTICANKNATGYRPESGPVDPKIAGQAYGVWSFISISIARDRERGANLFVEDAGLWTKNDNEQDFVNFLNMKKYDIARTNVECGRNSHVAYDKSYIGYAYTLMRPGEVGMAVTVGPYVTLAQGAIPMGDFNILNSLSLSQWLSLQK